MNLATLAGLFSMAFLDPHFPVAASQTRWLYDALGGDVQEQPGSISKIGFHAKILLVLAVTGLSAMPAIVLTLFAGAEQHRRLRAWFAFTLLVAAWLTLFVAWREIAWQGQRMRLWTQLDEYEPIADELREKWPSSDGELPTVGAFMAYPQGNPRMLLILDGQRSDSAIPRFSAVERDDDGSLKFELADDETGSWLEWHPAGSAPDNFTGGLENTYTRVRSAPLGNGWYLVRYR